MTQKALFLDRDGVINHETNYLYRIEDVRFVDGICSLCRTAQLLGYRLIIITNQSGIARGLFTTAQFQELMDWMREQFRLQDIILDAVYFCPYHPEHGIGEFRREHEDRKPGTGMLRRGAEAFSLDLSQCLLVGDRCSDIAAANAAGLRQAFLLAGTESSTCPGDYLAMATLAEVEGWLLKSA